MKARRTQQSAWNHLLELFTFQGSSPEIPQCPKEALTHHFALDVIYPDRGSNPGEIGNDAHDIKQGFLLARRARLVTASEVVHSFSSDKPRLRVDGRRSAPEGKGDSGRARIEQIVKRVGPHAGGSPPCAAVAMKARVSTDLHQRETVPSRFCDAVGGIMAPPRWRPRCCALDGRDCPLRMGAAHTDPSLVTVVAARLFWRVVKVTDGSQSVRMDAIRSRKSDVQPQCSVVLQYPWLVATGRDVVHAPIL